MTERLYYVDPQCRTFDATVTAVERRGDRLAVFLDRTAFYPTSGGQPFDTGTLGGLPVIDVIEEDDGRIAHVAASGPGVDMVGTGAAVTGAIDWARRLDHMQQHTGQHLLSATIEHLRGARTLSVHLGAEACTVDIDKELTTADLAAIEDEVNRVVWADHPISIRFVTAAEAAMLPLRKESRRDGMLRLIEVADVDLSACGGTHVDRTGSVGPIAVTAWERFKGGQRVSFVCGGRAVARGRVLRDTVTACVRLLSVLPEELPATVERLQGEVRERKREAAEMHGELARFRAMELSAAAEPVGGARLALGVLDVDVSSLKAVAAALTVARGFVAVLVSKARPAQVVVACSRDAGVSAQRVLAGLMTQFGGRGGGRPELAQGGSLDVEPADLLAAARQHVMAEVDGGR